MENNSTHSLKSLSSDEINKIEEFRKSNRTAVLAILFSDIVNSTYAAEKLGEQTYSRLRHIHDELFKRIMCRDNAGIIIKEIGDSFLCVFAEPSTAVLRAVEFQRAIFSNKENLSDQDYTLSVKIGIHVGQVAVENTLALDIFGRHVNRAARIEALARGGQILTSLSIWENAVGWLKDNNEEKIGWVSYGKVKLKGIDERVDIFGFYPKEIGKLPAPKIISKRKQIKILFLLIGFVLIAGLSFMMLKKMSKEVAVLPAAQKTYYVQFDFSEIANQSQDTLAIAESLLSQIIAVLNPDAVITESDLKQSFSEKGIFYTRHASTDNNIEYFGDTLKFSGALFISAKKRKTVSTDSLLLKYRLEIYPPDHILSVSEVDYLFSLNNLANDFRNKLQEALFFTSPESWTVQGRVISCNDSIFLFRLSNQAKLRTGASLRFCREYIDNDGLQQELEDIKKHISFLKDKPQYSTLLKEYLKQYDEKEKLSHQEYKSKWCNGVDDLKGKVIELYDSTGKASWGLVGKFPFERPKAGDILYLTY